jgi:hypothetical protein
MNDLTFTDDEARVFSKRINGLSDLNSLYTRSYNNKFTSVGVVWLTDALSSKANLHTLVLAVTDIHDIIPLTKITTLIILIKIIVSGYTASLSYYIDMDSTLAVMLEYLKHFTSLKTFSLKANCSDWRDSDKIRVVSQVFSKV